jgi:hypothetical protein
VAISAFIDVDGAFDNTGFDSIGAAAERRHIELKIVEWIIRMFAIKVANGASYNKDHQRLPSRRCFIASSMVPCKR